MKFQKKISSLLGALVLVGSLWSQSAVVNAEGSTTIYVSGNSVTVGESVNVEVDASESGSINLTYNPDVLEFNSANVEYTTSGNTITFNGTNGRAKFVAKAAGSSTIVVSSDSNTGSSTSISVTGDSADSSAATSTSTSDAGNESNAGDGVIDSNGHVVIGDVEYVVSEKFSDDEIPVGFSRTHVTIAGYDYRAVTDDSKILIYLKDASNVSGSGTFYIYNKDANSVSKFLRLGTSAYYIIPSDHEAPANATFVAGTIDVEGTTVNGFFYGDNQDFFYVYGTDLNGTEGWYQYDQNAGTVQRVNEELLSMAGQPQDSQEAPADNTQGGDYEKKWQRQRIIIAILVFLIVILGVITVNVILSSRRNDEDGEDEEDDSEENSNFYELDLDGEDEDSSEEDEDSSEEDFEDDLGDNLVDDLDENGEDYDGEILSDDDIESDESADDIESDEYADDIESDEEELESESDEIESNEEIERNNIANTTQIDLFGKIKFEDDTDDLFPSDETEGYEDDEDEFYEDDTPEMKETFGAEQVEKEPVLSEDSFKKSYVSMRGGEAFRSAKETKYKPKEEKLTIIDLNDL